MAHYALLDENNIVVNVIVGKDEDDTDVDWEQFYSEEIGCVCKRTSYNTSNGVHNSGGEPFRKNYAGIGYHYDESLDAFIPPKVYDSWSLDEESCVWVSPVAYPNDGASYYWDESILSWVQFEEPVVPESIKSLLPPGWVWDSENSVGVPPIPYPEDGFGYIWNVKNENWVLAIPGDNSDV